MMRCCQRLSFSVTPVDVRAWEGCIYILYLRYCCTLLVMWVGPCECVCARGNNTFSSSGHRFSRRSMSYIILYILYNTIGMCVRFPVAAVSAVAVLSCAATGPRARCNPPTRNGFTILRRTNSTFGCSVLRVHVNSYAAYRRCYSYACCKKKKKSILKTIGSRNRSLVDRDLLMNRFNCLQRFVVLSRPSADESIPRQMYESMACIDVEINGTLYSAAKLRWNIKKISTFGFFFMNRSLEKSVFFR